MTRLFGRRGRLRLGSIDLAFGDARQLRVTFGVKKTIAAEDPSTCEVCIYNLARETRARFDQVYDPVTGLLPLDLQAGYGESIGTCYAGNASTIHSYSDGPDMVTKITATATGKTKRKDTSVVFAKGTDMRQVLEQFLRETVSEAGVAVKDAIQSVRDGRAVEAGMTLFTNFAMAGDPVKLMAQMGGDYGFRVAVDDGNLLLYRSGSARSQEQVVLDAASGLIGVVERISDKKRPGKLILSASSLIAPRITLGSRVKIVSAANRRPHTITTGADLAAVIVAEQVEHTGDTHGEAWTTKVVGAEPTG